MTVKEFLSMIDLESTFGQEICVIIPLKDKIFDLNNISIGDKQLSEKEKVIFNCDEASVYEDSKYSPFGIEPCFKNDENDTKEFEAEMLENEKLSSWGYGTEDNNDDNDNEVIDVRISVDGYHYVYDEDGAVWVVVY